MKKVVYCVVVAVLLAGLLLGCAPKPAPRSEPIVLKALLRFPSFLVLNNPIVEILVPMVEEQSNGELIIDILGGPEVIGEKEQVPALQKGIIDIDFNTTGEFMRLVPQIVLGDYSPYIAPEERERGIYDYWVGVLEEINVHYLGRWLGGMDFYLYLKDKRVEKIADLEGLKFMTLGASDAFMPAVGIVPVDISGPDIYSSLERGLIDGFTWPDVAHFPGWEEQFKYFLDEAYLPAEATSTILVNLDTWNGLPRHLQDVLTNATAEFEVSMVEYFLGIGEGQRQTWRDAGIEFLKFSPEESKQLREIAMEASWEANRDLVDPETYAKLRELLMP